MELFFFAFVVLYVVVGWINDKAKAGRWFEPSPPQPLTPDEVRKIQQEATQRMLDYQRSVSPPISREERMRMVAEERRREAEEAVRAYQDEKRLAMAIEDEDEREAALAGAARRLRQKQQRLFGG